ncbi:MAG: hypoxanthine-guanine phosphoribosyltransferase [Gammaproteobacteria bacterium]
MAEVLSVRASAECLFDRSTVERHIDRLAAQVNRDYAALNPVMLIALKGGCYLAAKLMDRLVFPLQVDVLQLTRYRDQLSGGALHTGITPATPLAGRHLLIIDDILDQGVTLEGMTEFCHRQRPASVKSLVLIDKQCHRQVAISADYAGVVAPDRYLFGCGMDYKGYWRNLPAIYAVAVR